MSILKRRRHTAAPRTTGVMSAVPMPTSTKGPIMPETTIKPFIDHLAGDRALPKGTNTWGFKIVRADLTTWKKPDGTRFQWSGPGTIMNDPNTNGTDLCPSETTGGFAIAKNLRGARDGQYGHSTILLLAYHTNDVVASGDTKVRVSKAHVVAVVHGADVYMNAAGVDLSGADLNGANLRGARLDGASLAGAVLRGALLQGASLRGTSFAGANVSRAAFNGANAEGAVFTNTSGVHVLFSTANLAGADFTGADLSGANLSSASVAAANFTRASLVRANLKHTTGRVRGVTTAKLDGAVHSDRGGSFKPLMVPYGRRDIFDALTEAGIYAEMTR